MLGTAGERCCAVVLGATRIRLLVHNLSGKCECVLELPGLLEQMKTSGARAVIFFFKINFKLLVVGMQLRNLCALTACIGSDDPSQFQIAFQKWYSARARARRTPHGREPLLQYPPRTGGALRGRGAHHEARR